MLEEFKKLPTTDLKTFFNNIFLTTRFCEENTGGNFDRMTNNGPCCIYYIQGAVLHTTEPLRSGLLRNSFCNHQPLL